MSTHHYDERGNFKGTSQSGGDGDGGLLVLGIALFGIWTLVSWLWEQVVNFHDLKTPYSWVGAFYFVVIVTPIRFARWIFTSVRTPGLTSWPNLNLVIGILLVILYVGIIVCVIIGVVRMIDTRTRLKQIEYAGVKLFIAFITAPAAFALLWFIVASIVRWLFAPAPV